MAALDGPAGQTAGACIPRSISQCERPSDLVSRTLGSEGSGQTHRLGELTRIAHGPQSEAGAGRQDNLVRQK